AGESTRGRGHDVVERGRVLGVLPGRGAVVLTDGPMSAEDDRLRLGGQVSLANRAALPHYPNLGHVDRAIHERILRTSFTTLWNEFVGFRSSKSRESHESSINPQQFKPRWVRNAIRAFTSRNTNHRFGLLCGLGEIEMRFRRRWARFGLST